MGPIGHRRPWAASSSALVTPPPEVLAASPSAGFCGRGTVNGLGQMPTDYDAREGGEGVSQGGACAEKVPDRRGACAGAQRGNASAGGVRGPGSVWLGAVTGGG